MKTNVGSTTLKGTRRKTGSFPWAKARKMRLLYLLLIIPVVQLFIFHYLPMYGILIAFKEYRYSLGIIGSKWNDFAHFKQLFNDVLFARIFRNTFIISAYRIIFGFPMPILLALLINEIGNLRFRKIVQSITYLPHFVSWVILAGIVGEIISPQRGVIAYIFTLFGKEPINFLTSKALFRPFLIITEVWKEMGWNAVIYLAALSSIDPNLYEAADIDGANRFQKGIHITIPSLIPVITILFILRLGGILNAGFDQIFNLYNPLVYEVADIIDTYVYRVGLIEARYDFSTAVGLFKNVIGVILILATNTIIKRYSDYGIW